MAERKDRGPAVLDGKIRYLSVSALQKYKGCARAYYFRYVMRLPDKPQSKAQRLGIEGHDRWETYYNTGTNVLSEVEQQALDRDLLPPYGTPGLIVEGDFEGGAEPLTARGVKMVGYMDLQYPARHQVLDHKYKGRPKKYPVTSKDLVDPKNSYGQQMLAYGTHFRLNVLRDLSDNEVVVLSHVVFNTEGAPDAFRTDANQELGQIGGKWEQITDCVPAMQKLVQLDDVMDAEPNYNQCSAFGGCAYMDRCHNPMDRLLSSMKKFAVDTNKETNYSNQTSEVKTMGNLMRGLLLGKEALKTEAPAVADAVSAPAVGIVPPDAPLFSIEIPPTAVVAVAEADATPQAPPKRGPGRPRKNPLPETGVLDNTPTTATPVTAEAQPTPSPVKDLTPKEVQAEAVVGVSPKAETRLYIGCAPGAGGKSLAPYVEELNAKMCEALSLPYTDLRCIEVKPLSFGGWRGALAMAVKASPPPPASYVVTQWDEREQIVAAALAGMLPAEDVVRGSGI